MDEAMLTEEPDAECTDRSAILMMLTYVAAECRRLGSEEAARHACMAATLVQGVKLHCATDCVPRGDEQRLAPLH
ncbi:hypothetical protein GXW74_14820 [Roseomonas eburnea]|uniref:Uncharacterized protein n=1 Tax=Neoroseomonas eburnea TaxID=1346889 RepID=A0A9X9XDH9_9PROT|nr:hypothetical protein [Neoroseomonas eburnea]MBR0681765.1 hypothetical protein [Neoroseomonas eburnea]